MTTTPVHLSPTQKTLQDIDVYIRARYPILYIVSHEEMRIEAALGKVASTQKKNLFVWSSSTGLNQANAQAPGSEDRQNSLSDPIELLSNLKTREGAGIYLLKDFHPYLNDPTIVRHTRDVANHLKNTYNTLILVSPLVNLPRELEKDVTLIDFPLPDVSELMELLKSICQTVSKNRTFSIELSEADGWQLARAAQGMTLSEAENAFAKAVVTDSALNAKDISQVLEEKQQIVRKSQMLDFHHVDAKQTVIGGLTHLKAWLDLRGHAFSTQASQFGLPQPKGVLLLGAPGCGKSLTAKAIAAAWRLPLLQLDFGKVFSGLVGSSEENMRLALRVACGVAPAVLWIDELEKGLSGNSTGQSDGGTAARVFGTFLTWMQEKTAPVFVIATANRIDALPPELLRRGRFDEVFFVDLPNARSRAEILSIHLTKRNRKPEQFQMKELVAATHGFSGAEIEHIIVEGLFLAYSQSRDLTTQDILFAASQTVPLSVTYREDLIKLREWAKVRARPADEPETRVLKEERSLHLEERPNGQKAV